MTKQGGKIENVSEDELKEYVEIDTDSKPYWRLVVAIEYKNGLSPTQIEAKYGISKNNVYTWLDRFEERGVEAALHDTPKPGREPKLTDEEWEQFVEDLNTSPEKLGYDYQAWFPVLAYHHLKTEFDVEYCLRHVRRLLDKAELSWRTARPPRSRPREGSQIPRDNRKKNETTSTNRI